MKFLRNESTFFALLLASLGLWLTGLAPTGFHATVLVIGLASVWLAILLTSVSRL